MKILYDIDTCSKCTECERTCPVGLRPYLTFMMVKNRKTLLGKLESKIANIMVNHGEFFRIIFKAMMKIKGIKNKRKMMIERKGKTERKRKKEIKGERGEKIAFFPTCFGYKIIPDIKEHAENIMNKIGVDFYEIEGFLCCGASLFLSGDMTNFRKNAERFRKKLKDGTEKIVVLGDTCTWILKNIVQKEVVELTKFMLETTEERKINLASNGCGEKVRWRKIFLHKPCHSEERVEHINRFLERMGFEVELSEFPCCGFGGSMFFKYQRFSELLLEKTLEGKKFDVVVTTSPGCMIQLMKKCDVIHPVEIISGID